MAQIEVEGGIAASADAVWDVVRDFGGITKWSPGVKSCEVEGEGVGAIRTLSLGGGPPLRERLEARNDAERSLSYSILDGPLPVSGYLATIRVREEAGGSARVEWSSRFEPRGVSEEQVRAILRGVYEGGISALRKHLQG